MCQPIMKKIKEISVSSKSLVHQTYSTLLMSVIAFLLLKHIYDWTIFHLINKRDFTNAYKSVYFRMWQMLWNDNASYISVSRVHGEAVHQRASLDSDQATVLMRRQKGNTTGQVTWNGARHAHAHALHTDTLINRYSVKTAGTVTFGVIQNQ